MPRGHSPGSPAQMAVWLYSANVRWLLIRSLPDTCACKHTDYVRGHSSMQKSPLLQADSYSACTMLSQFQNSKSLPQNTSTSHMRGVSCTIDMDTETKYKNTVRKLSPTHCMYQGTYMPGHKNTHLCDRMLLHVAATPFSNSLCRRTRRSKGYQNWNSRRMRASSPAGSAHSRGAGAPNSTWSHTSSVTSAAATGPPA